MKKTMRTFLSLLFVLVFAFQITGSFAWADDAKVEVTGKETLVYEICIPNPDTEAKEKLLPVSAEQEGEIFGGKKYAVVLGHDDPDAKPEKKAVPLSRTASEITLNDLLKEDLVITPPEGFVVTQLYLRGDALESHKPVALPVTADKEKTELTLKAGTVFVKDEETEEDRFDKEMLSTFSTVDPQIYTLVIVFSPIDAEKDPVVTEALDAEAKGLETKIKRGESYLVADAPADTDEHKFDCWQVRYESGATLSLKPGDSFKPYADCRVEAQWIEIITISANMPVEAEEGFRPDGSQYTGTLAKGDEITEVTLTVNQDGNQFVCVPSDAVIKHGDRDVTDRYELHYVPSEAAIKEDSSSDEGTEPVDPEPAPKTDITIAANAPITNDGGKTYQSNGHSIVSGELNDGDEISSLSIDVKKNDDGSYVAIPSGAVIKNGDTDHSDAYNITYLPSESVTPPAPEKVKITITANKPVTKDGGKTYEHDSATITEGKLNDGDALTQLAIGIKKNDDGSYVAIPSDAVIKNGDTDNTASYDITYIQSEAVTPSAEKIAITIRSKDRTAEYTGKPITADSYEITSGKLAEGDTVEVKYEGGSTNVTSSPAASTIASVIIKDSAGNDVTASKYAVTIDNDNAGKVTVTKHDITVTAITGTVTTDGNKVIYAKDCKTANGSFNKGYKAEGLLEGHALQGDFVKGSGKETFTTSIDPNAVKIVDTANGNADVTANYNVKTVDGKMTIKVKSQTGVPVAVTIKDQSWTYDGAAHQPQQDQYSVSGLLDGDVATVTLTLKQGETQLDAATNAGSYTIVPVVTIKTKDGAAVDENKYHVTAANATLTVKKYDITLEAVSDTKAYDGKALSNDKVKAPSLPAGHKYQGVKLNVFDSKGNLVTNGVVNVGTYTKKIIDVHIYDAKGVEVTDNYNITKVDGKLTITQGTNDKNNSKGVKTGDDSHDTMPLLKIVFLVAALLLVALIVIFIILNQKKKKQAEAPQTPSYGDEYFEPDELAQDWQQAEPAQDWTANQQPENWQKPQDWDPMIPPENWDGK